VNVATDVTREFRWLGLCHPDMLRAETAAWSRRVVSSTSGFSRTTLPKPVVLTDEFHRCCSPKVDGLKILFVVDTTTMSQEEGKISVINFVI
jgi:hypothetical protein